MAKRREAAEQALAERSERREALSARAHRAQSAAERIELRLDGAREHRRTLDERVARARADLDALEREAVDDPSLVSGGDEGEAIAALEAELRALDADRAAALEAELSELAAQREGAAAEEARLAAVAEERRGAVAVAEEACAAARAARHAAEGEAETARREAARVGADLAAVNQFLRGHAGAPGGATALSDQLSVEGGHELALAAALGGLLGAAVVPDRAAGAAVLERAGRDGGAALVAGTGGTVPSVPFDAPVDGARRLLDLVRGADDVLALVGPLLAGVWVVEDLEAVPADWPGTAVTPTGRVWSGARGELRQVPAGGSDRVLAERNRRDALVAATETAARSEQTAGEAVESARAAVVAAEATRDEAEATVRDAVRARDAAREEERRAALTIDRRRAAPDEGPRAVRRAQLEAELAAERRHAERLVARRAERERRAAALGARAAEAEGLIPAAERLALALETAQEAVRGVAVEAEAALAADREAGEGVAAELRACAELEAAVQIRLRDHGERVTQMEVAAQRARDRDAEAAAELAGLAETLGLEAEPAPDALPEEERAALLQRVERLARRREQLGPVNPLAQDEYAEALAYVEELETRREDLETALRELADLVRDTDRQIRRTFEETFTAAAKNFEEVAQRLFPGGRGALRLVREDSGPRAVLGGAEPEAAEAAADAEAEAAEDEDEQEDLLGVEIEITPAGKSTKRLSLLSGGEKSMTALAFLFAVFLARPCPFYILDEVEAALDDLNITRFLELLGTYADRAQFIVVTHQKRTMEAADTLYGVSMAGDGISKVISRRLPPAAAAA